MPTVAEQANIDNINKAFGGNNDAPIVETKIEPVVAPIVEAKAETVAAPVVEETPEAKTAREESEREQQYISKFIEKKTEGKFKTFDDYEKEALKPKEVVKEVVKNDFADENIARWNEMAKNGVKITRELLDLETKDFDKMDDLQIHIDKMKTLDEGNKKYPDNILVAKIKKQYDMAAWHDEDGKIIPDNELPEDILVSKQMFALDAQTNRELLNKYKNERVVFQKPDPAILASMDAKKQVDQKNWEQFVETEIVAKSDKVLAEVEDAETKQKHSFEFAFSEDVKKEAAEMMKKLKFNGGYFDSYISKDAEGKQTVNDAKIYQDYVKARDFDKAMAASLKQGIALGKIEAEKRVKNTDFTPEETGATATKKEGLEAAVQGMKFT